MWNFFKEMIYASWNSYALRGILIRLFAAAKYRAASFDVSCYRQKEMQEDWIKARRNSRLMPWNFMLQFRRDRWRNKFTRTARYFRREKRDFPRNIGYLLYVRLMGGFAQRQRRQVAFKRRYKTSLEMREILITVKRNEAGSSLIFRIPWDLPLASLSVENSTYIQRGLPRAIYMLGIVTWCDFSRRGWDMRPRLRVLRVREIFSRRYRKTGVAVSFMQIKIIIIIERYRVTVAYFCLGSRCNNIRRRFYYVILW